MFNDLKVTDSFRNSISLALKNGRLSHALIIEGSDDETRFAVAKEIAAAIMCESSMKPCGICQHCVKCSKEIHPDLHISEKEADSTMIKVDAVRKLRDKVLLFPNEAKKSVFIIRQAQLMNTQAQNALLKIFEEPSPHICFILTCPSKSAFLDTIISRATLYSVGEEIIESSGKEERAADIANELLISFARENEFSFIRKTAVFQKDKQLLKQVVFEMIPIVRDALIVQSRGKEILSAYGDTARMLAQCLTQKKVLRILTLLGEFYDSLQFSPNHNLAITRLSSILFSVKSK